MAQKTSQLNNETKLDDNVNSPVIPKAAAKESAVESVIQPTLTPPKQQQQSQQQQNGIIDENSTKSSNKIAEINDHSKQNGHVVENNNNTTSTTGDQTEPPQSIDQSSKSMDVFEVVQDTGFDISIQSPGMEPLQIKVSSSELVQEIHQLLMDREDTCHRTCFSLQLDGVTLDNFAELKNIDGLQEGSIVKVAEEPYTMREARIHVRHVRDLLKSMDPTDAYNGMDCFSLTFLHSITQGDLLEKKKMRPESVDCTPPEYIMPGAKDRPLLPLQPSIKNAKGPPSIKVLTTSAWNPPPGPRKLHGDLMYLYVITMEDKRFHITACPRGFYVNQSSEETFNPKPDSPSHLCHSLIDLLAQISPTFKRSFAQMVKKRTQRHPFERVATPYQVYTWSAPALEHTLDAIRAEDTFSSKLGYEEHIPGQTRDWNEELQTTRELPRKGLNERLQRERAIFKVHSDFVTAATRGAMAVIDGNVMAINPGEDAKMQMFIWNNIFFSLGFDVRDHYKELGGDAAAFVAPRNDLHGVRVYSAVDVEGLYTLGTVIIDYRGYRVTAQSIIPGILEREQEQSVVYGSIDFGKTVLGHAKYLELLNKAGEQLKILPHSVLNDKDESVEICSSVECKGIIGNDGRHYILDLLRTFPPDVNFLTDIELSPAVVAKGFPIEHKHKLSCLRQELLDAYVDSLYAAFIKFAAYHLHRMNAPASLRKAIEIKKAKEAKATENKSDTETNNNNNNNNTTTTTTTTTATSAASTTPTTTQSVTETTVSSSTVTTTTPSSTTPTPPAAAAAAAATTATETNKNEQDESSVSESVPTGVPKAYAEEAKTIMETLANNEKYTSDSKDIVRRACAAVGSLKESEFDIRFNADVFSPGIRHVDNVDAPNSLKQQKKLVIEAAQFLLLTQIPAFVNDCIDHSSAPMDGVTLTEAMHNRGINMRYLGKVATLLMKIPKLEYLYTISVQELILRATKHIFYVYMQNTDLMNLASAISHFLNCFLMSGAQTLSPILGQEELQKSVSSKRRNKQNKKSNGKSNFLGTDNSEWATLSQKSLWQQIKKELKQYWGFDLGSDFIDAAVEQYHFHKLGLLRAFCLKVGIQILLREYNFESRNKATFNEDDIVNVFPIVKHINPRASDAYNFYTTGQQKIQQGLFKEGFELISEALNLLNNVYGAMHSENAQCLRMLARLSYIMGDPKEALAIQQRAVLMSERVNGIDHPYTISEYTHLALYCFANTQISTALKLLYRARYLTLLICGDNHPDLALLDSNISLILHAVGEYELSLRFLEHALALNIKYYGEKSLKVAVSYHLVARTQSCMGDFRSALNSEKETYAIYKKELGETHDKTQESSECLRHLTQQAVVLQKKMNNICSNGKITAELPPIHIQPPSMDSVLDMLNAINGILFIQISPTDIANLKNEMEKRQREINDEGDENPKNAELLNGNVSPPPTIATNAAASAEITTTTQIIDDNKNLTSQIQIPEIATS